MESKKYRAFISYSHADQKWGEWLHRSLESYRVPKNLFNAESSAGRHFTRLTPIFRDREELASSPDLSQRINDALADSEALIVVCSPSAAKSKWVDQEIETFKKLGRSQHVHCLIVAGDPGTPGAEADCFPPSLRIRFDSHGRRIEGVAEPIAADAREIADGRKLARLKIIAGLLDVGLDRLRQRELQRRNRRLLGITTSSIAATVLTALLAINAVLARNEATERRAQAESLISFMLGDLRERLQPVGRLDVLDGVGEQALAYFSSLDRSEMTGSLVLTRATALRQIGEVRVAQGLIEEGLVAFREAENLLANSKIDNEGARLFELGQINYWIADAYFSDVQLEEAQSHIVKYLQISRELVELEPSNADYQLELAYAESNLATLSYRAGDIETARTGFSKALSIARHLAQNQPSDANDLELALAISWVGAIEASVGNFVLAQNWYEEELALHRSRLISKDEPARKHFVGRSLWLLADTYEQAGDSKAAVAALDESVQLYRELADFDPQNYRWQQELAWTLILLARHSYTAGKLSAKEADTTLRRATQALARINNQNTAEVKRVLAANDVARARIEITEGNPEPAAELAARAADILRPLIYGEDRIRLLPLFAETSYVMSEAAFAKGNEIESRELAEAALDTLNVRQGDHVKTRVYVSLLAFRADRPNANDLLSKISATEYRGSTFIPGTETESWWGQLLEQTPE